ncbi:unnamed protein product [Closterium sp. NIES-54]
MGADGRLVGLKRVLLVPGLCANLLSTKALSEAGMKMEMMGTKVFKATLDGCVLWDLRGGKDMHQSMTIIEGGRTILVDSGLSLRFWPLAIRHATVIKNQVLTHMGGQHWVPIEKWSGKKPLVDMLRVFGCMGLVHVPKEKRDKLQAAAVWAVHWGLMFKEWSERGRSKVTIPLGIEVGTNNPLLIPIELSSSSELTEVSHDLGGVEGEAADLEEVLQQGEAPIAERGDTEEEVQQPTPSSKLPPRRTTQGKRDAVRGGAKEGAAKERPKRAAHPRDFLKYERLGVPKALLVQEEEYEEEKGAEGEMEQICCFGDNLPHEPASMEEALAGDDREAWLASREDEFQSHMENETWTLTNLSPGRKGLDYSWMLRIKTDAEGRLERRKTRLVIKGFQQREGIDFQEVFAPVAKAPTLRLLLAAAAVCGWKVEQMDVKTAFLYGVVDEEIYMKQPEGYDDGSGCVCRLNKAIYGLKQAPRTIIEGGRTILVDSGLSLRFWPLAIRHATVIKNQVLTHMGGQHWVPIEKWSGKKPLVDMLRVFGCMGLVHVPKEKRDKLQAAAVWAVHWGLMFKEWSERGRSKVTIPLGIEVGTNNPLLIPIELSSSSELTEVSHDLGGVEGEAADLEEVLQQGEAPIAERGDTEEEVQQPTPSSKLPPRRTTQGKRDAVRGGAKEGAAKERPKRAAHPRDFLKYERLGVPKALLVQEEEYEEEKGAEGEMEQICCFGDNLPHEPASMEEALAGDDREAWLASREDEFQSHMENETWTLTNLSPGRKGLDYSWMLRIKTDAEGRLERRKTRLVIKGFQQREGIDFQEVFAPVAKAPTLRLLLAAAAVCGWKVEQMDVKTAFLYGVVDEEIYMKQPEGYDDGSGCVCRLNKAIYGLKQAPRCWITSCSVGSSQWWGT